MTNKDLLELSWGNLLRRKTRTILSIVGVVVGTCAIVVMLSIGFGLTAGFEEEIASWGNLHTIQVYNYGGGRDQNGQTVSLDDNTISKIGKIKNVTAITPVNEQYVTIGIGHMNCQTSIYGIDPNVMELLGYEVGEGRMLNSTDADKNVLVFGMNIPSWFYNPRQQQGGGRWGGGSTEATVDVITKDIIITGDWSYNTSDQGTGDYQYEYFKAEGIGVLANENDESSYRVYMPIEALSKIQESIQKSEKQSTAKTGKKTYNQALIYVEDIDKIGDICDEIKDTYNFETYSLNDTLESMNEMALMIEGILGGIGAISLLVAAIGIANTMVMSVYERTREIGVMKVIGASLRDIGNMFMVEAAMIGFIGGAVGIAISYGISLLLNTVFLSVIQGIIGGGSSVVSVIPVWVALAALGFATLMGLVSGYYPAKRAMKLSALEGLRND